MILNTYFLHPAAGACPSAGRAPSRRTDVPAPSRRARRRRGQAPVLMLLETDAIGTSGCVRRRGGLGEWEALLRYEIGKVAALPHVVAYVEGGYEDADTAGYSAKVLNAVGVRRIRGFYTNDTHLNWTINEVRWATRVSRMTHGAHFIVNTSQNGNGPLLNRPSEHAGDRGSLQPAGPRAGAATDHAHRFHAGGCVAVDLAPRQQRRHLQRRPAGRHVLDRAGGLAGRERQQPPRPAVPQPALLVV